MRLARARPIYAVGGERGRAMKKRFLVPIDFSEHSLDAVHAARELVLGLDAELTLIHVLAPGVSCSPPTPTRAKRSSRYGSRYSPTCPT